MIGQSTSYKVEVELFRRDTRAHIHTLPVECRHWWSVPREVLGWLAIEVLPYWPNGSLLLAWDEQAMDLRINGALYGVALVLNMLPDDKIPLPPGSDPYPDLRPNHS